MSVPFTEDQVAADLMLRKPKTLPGSATVEDVRAQLADPKMQLVLLADGETFVGAVTSLPPDAPADARAADYADESADTIAPPRPRERRSIAPSQIRRAASSCSRTTACSASSA